MEQSLGTRGYEALFKVVFVGDPEAGKRDVLYSCVPAAEAATTTTTTTKKAAQGRELPMVSTGVDFLVRCVELDGRTFKLQLWDAAGRHGQRALSSSAYYRGAAGAVLVYDVTREESFGEAEAWLGEVREHADSCTVVLLVGTQCHRKHLRSVSTSDAEAFAAREGLLFAETSPPDPSRLQAAFRELVAGMYDKREEFEAHMARPAEPAPGTSAHHAATKTKRGRKRGGSRRSRKHKCILL